MKEKVYKVGSRGSPLALAQTQLVLGKLREMERDISGQTQVIRTEGDLFSEQPFLGFSNKGIFVRAIEEALLRDEIDFAVHSAKDFPTQVAQGLKLVCVLPREDPHDAFVGREGVTFASLKEQGGRVGTASFRRQAQLRIYSKQIEPVPVRGNVDTRLRKIQTESLSGVVVASAGLRRLGVAFSYEVIPYEAMLPAVGQGILVVEAKEGREEIQSLFRHLHDPDTATCLEAERACLATLGGGCHLPVGALATLTDAGLQLYAAVFSLDGERVLSRKETGQKESARQMGIRLAEHLLAAGARELLQEKREK